MRKIKEGDIRKKQIDTHPVIYINKILNRMDSYPQFMAEKGN